MKELSKQLLEAASSILSEAKEAPFKVGDRVMTAHHGTWTTRYTNPGTVVKTNGFGHMHVEHDHDKGVHVIYGHDRYRKDSSRSHGSPRLAPEKEGVEHNDREDKRREHTSDMNSIIDTIAGYKNGHGHYAKLSKEHAAQISALIAKHTAED